MIAATAINWLILGIKAGTMLIPFFFRVLQPRHGNLLSFIKIPKV